MSPEERADQIFRPKVEFGMTCQPVSPNQRAIQQIREAHEQERAACIKAIVEACIVCGGSEEGECLESYEGQYLMARCEYCGRPGDAIRAMSTGSQPSQQSDPETP